jgi:hypothetical protein
MAIARLSIIIVSLRGLIKIIAVAILQGHLKEAIANSLLGVTKPIKYNSKYYLKTDCNMFFIELAQLL